MHLRKLISCTEGATFTLIAAMLLLLLTVIGVTIDLGRIYAVQNKAQNALDASLLGAVATASTTDVNLEINKLFQANYPANYMGSSVGPISVAVSADGAYTATTVITLPTSIMNFFGKTANSINVLSQVKRDEARRLELTLVLDNTGSMANGLGGTGGTKIAALRQASKDLINIIYGSAASLGTLHVSIVPYDVDVHLPGHAAWIQTAYAPFYTEFVSNRNSDSPRNALVDVSDDVPSSDTTRFRVPRNEANVNCSDTVTATMAPMRFGMSRKDDILAVIDTMQAGGCTRINVGLMWGWFTLSPKWQGMFDAGQPNLPEAPNPLLDKYIVLMTDGLNTVFSGRNGTSNDDATVRQLCDAIKGQNITIYTVGLGAPGDINPSLLQNCASQPGYYFNAPTTSDLQRVFHQIADSIVANSLRLTQ